MQLMRHILWTSCQILFSLCKIRHHLIIYLFDSSTLKLCILILVMLDIRSQLQRDTQFFRCSSRRIGIAIQIGKCEKEISAQKMSFSKHSVVCRLICLCRMRHVDYLVKYDIGHIDT